jgi:hypothetical protein
VCGSIQREAKGCPAAFSTIGYELHTRIITGTGLVNRPSETYHEKVLHSKLKRSIANRASIRCQSGEIRPREAKVSPHVDPRASRSLTSYFRDKQCWFVRSPRNAIRLPLSGSARDQFRRPPRSISSAIDRVLVRVRNLCHRRRWMFDCGVWGAAGTRCHFPTGKARRAPHAGCR